MESINDLPIDLNLWFFCCFSAGAIYEAIRRGY